ncbi:MAG: PEP-CTERM sorting domain-containing protein [Fuerstiella sp.]
MRKLVTTLVFAIAASGTSRASVDLNTWTEETYGGGATWTVSGGGTSVLQSQNGDPTMFYSDFNAQGTDVRGKIKVETSGDDDFIGFALGFNPGDSTSTAADYLLVDWKKANQFWDFGGATPGGTGYEGLAVSRVTGTPTYNEFWQHANHAANTSGGLNELARGATLGSTGWVTNTEYEFRFIFTPTNLQVFVDDVLQMNVSGAFADGRMAFYNFSQSTVRYSAFTVEPAAVPEPASFAMWSLLGGVGVIVHRRRRKA